MYFFISGTYIYNISMPTNMEIVWHSNVPYTWVLENIDRKEKLVGYSCTLHFYLNKKCLILISWNVYNFRCCDGMLCLMHTPSFDSVWSLITQNVEEIMRYNNMPKCWPFVCLTKVFISAASFIPGFTFFLYFYRGNILFCFWVYIYTIVLYFSHFSVIPWFQY